MKQENKISLIQPDGTELEANILLFFELEENGKQYIIYTFGDRDQNITDERVLVNASIFVKTESGYQLENMSDEEWNRVKDVMRAIIKEEE